MAGFVKARTQDIAGVRQAVARRWAAPALQDRLGVGPGEFSDGPCQSGDGFILQLWMLVGRDYPKAKHIHLILDNYRIHSNLQTKAALARLDGRVVLHFLPPYCPEHNRIERVWRDLHAHVTRNHQCRSMNELMQEVYGYLKGRHRTLQYQYSQKQAV